MTQDLPRADGETSDCRMMKASLPSPSPMRRILLTGDQYGIRELLSVVPREFVSGLIVAANRPQYHGELKGLARERGLPLFVQPSRNHADAFRRFLDAIAALAADGLICHSYSMLLPAEILNFLEGRAFNVHAALLPRNRGPNPVQWALIHGESETGVTLHLMEEELDSGPIVEQISIPVREEDTWVTLLDRIQYVSKRLLQQVIPKLLEGRWRATPQDDTRASRNPRIPKESFEIDFGRMSDREVFNLIRSQVAPLAGAYLVTASGKKHFREWVSMEGVRRLREKYT